MQRWL